MRRWLRPLSLVIAVVLGGAAGVRGFDAWRFRSAMEQANRAISQGRPDKARAILSGMAVRWPSRSDVAMRLGLCASAAGDIDAALLAWGDVAPGAPDAGPIAMRRATLAIDHGRLSIAEEAIERALTEGGVNRDEALSSLARVLRIQGRNVEVRRRLIDGLGQSSVPAELLRELWMVDTEPLPIEGVGQFLERAGKEAPEDDRVWLARANLALRTGRFDEAARWLDRCEQRRPADGPLWRARLDLARATGDVEAARRLLHESHAGRLTPADSASILGWFAAASGDRQGEMKAIRALLEKSPSSSEAIDRLAGLAAESGNSQEAAELRRRKADLDRARESFKKALARGDLDQSAELARLAGLLGRKVESQGWAILASEHNQDRPDVRASLAGLASMEPPGVDAAQVLAALSSTIEAKRDRPPPARLGSDRPMPVFSDDAKAAGLDFTFRNGQSPNRQFPESGSGGVGLIDFDGDGWLDVYCVQGGTFPPPPGPLANADRLFRNRRDGTFEDVSVSSRIASMPGGYGHGVTVGDFDNDGHPDLFVTRWRSYALYRNQGDSTFEDATERVGLGGDRDWPTSAAFADLDNDGDLDLYVCHYLKWDSQNPRICRHPKTGLPSYCDPSSLAHLPDHVFRNDKDRFVDVTAQSGFVDPAGRGLGVVAADFDEDGRIDLYVANDMSANYLFHNLGGFRFEEVASASGVAANASGGYQAGMGVAAGDLDGDGLLDVVVTNFYGESTTYFRNLGGGLFADHTAVVGLAVPTRFVLGFGVAFLDADNDRRLDLLITNGHVNDFRPDTPYAMPTQLLLGSSSGRLTDVTRRLGGPFETLRVGRGLAAGDLDNDGRVDALIVSHNEPMVYFHNKSPNPGHSLTVRLEGTTSNRDAVGARVRVVSHGQTQVAQRVGGGSYQSANDPRLHFGLGSARIVDSIEVTWPSGRVDRHESIAADRGYLIREGAERPSPLVGFPRE